MRSFLSLLLLFCVSDVFIGSMCPSAHAVSLWPFKSRASTVWVPLESDKGVFDVTAVYEFGEEFDRVSLESRTYPVLHGKEVFRGRIESVALGEEDFDRTISRLSREVRSRVHFFPSPLGKTEPGRRARQSFFTEKGKTHVLYYNQRDGLALLRINKVYANPREMEVYMSTGEVGRRHFLVTVKEEPRIIRTPDAYYDVFVEHLRQNGEREVFEALQALVKNQNNEGLTKEDRKNLKVIDKYLLELKFPGSSTFHLSDSQARRVRDALEMRLMGYGSFAKENWLFQFEPHLQDVEEDLIPFDGNYSSKKAFVRTDRSILLGTSAFSKGAMMEYRDGTDHLVVRLHYPDIGLSQGDHVEMDVPTAPELIDQINYNCESWLRL